MIKSYWNYIPIVLVIIAGFITGASLSFGVVFLGWFSFVEDTYGRTILALFGIGMMGASTYCAKFWSSDVYEVTYEKPEFLPHVLDFVGYLTLLVGGGITGVVLFLIFKTGMGVSVDGQEELTLSKEASALIAYMGGLYHFKVQNQLGKIMEKIFQEHRDKKTQKPQDGGSG